VKPGNREEGKGKSKTPNARFDAPELLRSGFTLLASLFPVSLVLLLLSLTTDCTNDQWQRFPSPDDAIAKFSWFSTMHRSVSIQPYAIPPRAPVPGTVPITGADPELRVDRTQDLPLLNRLKNPAARTSESLNRGQQLFTIPLTLTLKGDTLQNPARGEAPCTPILYPVFPQLVGLRKVSTQPQFDVSNPHGL